MVLRQTSRSQEREREGWKLFLVICPRLVFLNSITKVAENIVKQRLFQESNSISWKNLRNVNLNILSKETASAIVVCFAINFLGKRPLLSKYSHLQGQNQILREFIPQTVSVCITSSRRIRTFQKTSTCSLPTAAIGILTLS